MRTLTFVSLGVVLYAHVVAAGGETHRYLAELLQTRTRLPGFSDFNTAVNMSYFRVIFPQAFGVPRWDDFLDEHLKDGISETRAMTRYRQFLQGNLLLPTNVEAVLMREDVFRAHVLAYAFLVSTAPVESHNDPKHVEMLIASRMLVPLVMAIDADYELDELVERLLHLSDHRVEISLRRSPALVGAVPPMFNGYVGDYLFRFNHIKHADIGANEIGELRRRGYRDPRLHGMLSPFVAQLLTSGDYQRLAENNGRLGELDMALVVDLIAEQGIIGAGAIHPHHIIDRDAHLQPRIKELLLYEMGNEAVAGDDFWHEVESLLNAPHRPASLFQIVQLLRLGFDFADIAALSYWARDAIIVSNPYDKADFTHIASQLLATSGFDSTAINNVVAARGPLVFMLAQYGYELEAINQHDIDVFFELF